jgi:hypothetical protein
MVFHPSRLVKTAREYLEAGEALKKMGEDISKVNQNLKNGLKNH